MTAIDASDGPELRPIFVYGSLLNDNVYERVTNKQPSVIDGQATLVGFKRRRVKNKPYPACIALAGESVVGKLIDVSANERTTLDVFESHYYQRVTANVICKDKQCRADVYIWNREMDELDLDGKDWSFEEFMDLVANRPFKVSFDELQ